MRMFDPNNVRKAANAAINKAASAGRTMAKEMIRGEYNIKAKKVNDVLRVHVKAQGNQMYAIITARGLGTSLGYYDPRQEGFKMMRAGAGSFSSKYLVRNKKKRGDVTVKVKQFGGRKIVGQKYGNKPFLAVMKSGHVGVFVRTGEQRSSYISPATSRLISSRGQRYKGDQKIEELYTVDIGGLFQSKKIMREVKHRIEEQWKKEFPHQLDYYMGKIK